MKSKEFNNEINLEKIFGNIEEIYHLSGQLSSDLNSLIQDEEVIENENENVGAFLLNHIPKMEEVYKPYCSNYDDSIVIIDKLKDDEEFQAAVSEILEKLREKTSVFTLDSLLIKPVQRVLKYPLLIDQILKYSHVEDGQICFDIARAAKKIEDVANAINEDKRRKDLVRHYKSQHSDITVSERLKKLNLNSVKKKSNRLSAYIRRTGVSHSDIDDSRFEKVESRFIQVERTIKLFQSNIEDVLCCKRDFLQTQSQLSTSLLRFYLNDVDVVIKTYDYVMRRISEQLFRQYHDKVQLQIVCPVSTLIERYRAPHALIDKRFDKLLDYESSLRHPNTNNTQMAQNVYKALNNQLCEELPKLCDLSIELLNKCLQIFNQLHSKFLSNIIKELESFHEVLQLQSKSSTNTYKIIQIFRQQSVLIETELAKLSFMPKSFRIESPLKPSVKEVPQTVSTKEHLLQKYQEQDVFVVNVQHTSSDPLQISCVPGDIVCVLKKRSPMGDKEMWFVDHGDTMGFVPHSKLRQLDPVYDMQGHSSNQEPQTSVPGHTSSPSSSKSSSEEQLKYFKVDFSFDARKSPEISVKENEIILLIKDQDVEGNKEWMLIKNSEGHQGYIPSNYATPVDYL